MITVFEQKRFMSYRRHTLYNDRVVVETKTDKGKTKYEVKLEDLGFDLMYQSENRKVVKITSAVVIAILCWLVSMLIAKHSPELNGYIWAFVFPLILFTKLLLEKGKDDLFLTGGTKNLVFYRAVPSEEKVLEFIQLINKTTKNKIKDNYLSEFDQNDDRYLDVLVWLKKRDIISPEEFEEYKLDFDIRRLL